MESLRGFVSFPRGPETTRPAGAFFSVVVQAVVGEGHYRVAAEGRIWTVRSDLALSPGQRLVLRPSGTDPLVFRTHLGDAPRPAPTALALAFLGRGLAAVEPRLQLWSRWAREAAGGQRNDWAASLEGRGLEPTSPLTRALEPWLAWQADLEAGRSLPPPDDDEVWDLWNALPPRSGVRWFALPLTWTWEGGRDSGLLQARWHEVSGLIDRWHLTAAPAGVGLRVEATRPPGPLTVRLFAAEAGPALTEALAPLGVRVVQGWEAPRFEGVDARA